MNISYSYFLPGVQDVLQGGNGQLATARMDAWIQETGGPYLVVKDTGGQWCWQASVARQHSDPTDGFLCRKLTEWIVAVSWWSRFCAWQFAMQLNLNFMSTRSKAWVQFNQSQSNCNHLELHWWGKTGTGMTYHFNHECIDQTMYFSNRCHNQWTQLYLNLGFAPCGFQLGFPAAGVSVTRGSWHCDAGMFQGKQVSQVELQL